MAHSNLAEGQEFYGVRCQLVRDPVRNRPRVQPLPGQAVPTDLFVECSKQIREQHPFGTIFKIDVGVSTKPSGQPYLHSLKKHELLTEEEWNRTYGG